MSDSEAQRDAQAKRVESILDRIHWPQAFMFAFFLVCIVSAPIAFFTLVPEHTQEKLGNLPWTTIIGVGLPALGAGISGFLSPFMRSMVAKTDPDSKSPSTHVSPPAEGGDPDPTPRGAFRESQRPTDPEEPQ